MSTTAEQHTKDPETWAMSAAAIHEIDNVIEEHVATIRTLRSLFSERMDGERGIDFDTLYDVDRVLGAAAARLKAGVELWYTLRREALGIPHEPAVATVEDG